MLHSPHGDVAAAVALHAVPDALLPRELARAVEDDEVPLVHVAHVVHILGRLLQSFGNHGLQAAAQDPP